MRWKYVFLLLFLPGLAWGQYIGLGRPMSKGEALDSLAAKADTHLVNGLNDRFQADSTAKAAQITAKADTGRVRSLELRFAADSANKNTRLGNKPDSSKIKGLGGITITKSHDSLFVDGSGISGSGAPARLGDLLIATNGAGTWNIWNPNDSMAFSDTLPIAIDSAAHAAKNAGRAFATVFVAAGVYLVADTCWGRDSLYGDVKVNLVGAPGATVLKFTASGRYALHGNFRSKPRYRWTNITFKNIIFTNPAGDSYGWMEVPTSRSNDMVWENCKFYNWSKVQAYDPPYLAGIWTYGGNSWTTIATPAGTGWQFNRCVFDSVQSIAVYPDNVIFNQCVFTGKTFGALRPLGAAQTMVLNGCFWDWGVYSTLYNCGMFYEDGTSQAMRLKVNGGVFVKTADYYFGVGGLIFSGEVSVVGLSVIDPPEKRTITKLDPFASFQAYGSMRHFENCYFERTFLSVAGDDSRGLIVQGCTFKDSGYVNLMGSADKSVVTNNVFFYATTAITVASGNNNSVVGGNVFQACGTGLSDAGIGITTYNNTTVALEDLNDAKDWLYAWAADMRRCWRALFPGAGYQLPG